MRSQHLACKRQRVTGAEGGTADWMADRWLLGLLIAGLLVRIPVAVLTNPSAVFIGDDGVYARGAAALFGDRELEADPFVRPPLYFLFIAAAQTLSSEHWALLAKILQCFASVATAIPVYRTTRRIEDRNAARLAAGFLAFDPTSIAYSHLLWPETLFALLVAVLFDSLHDLEARTGNSVVVVGVVVGLAMLLKPVLGLLAPLLALSWVRRLGLRSGLRLTAVVGLATLFVISPWVIANRVRYGGSIVLENQGPYNLWIGNDPRAPSIVHQEWAALGDPVTRGRIGTAKGFEAILADPSSFVRRSAIRALNLWGLEFFAVRNLIFGGYGPLRRETLLVSFWVIELGYLALLLPAGLGLRAVSRDPTMQLALAYAAVFTLLVSGMVSTTRFRVPFEFVLCVAAGVGAGRLLAGGLTWRDGVVAFAALGVLMMSAHRQPFAEIVCVRFSEVASLRKPEWFYFRY